MCVCVCVCAVTFSRMECEPTAMHLSRTAVPGQYVTGWEGGQTVGVDGCIDGWVDGWMDGWMDE